MPFERFIRVGQRSLESLLVIALWLGYNTHLYDKKHLKNQSVENAGVAFVKGAYERNKFFEKINNT